MNGESEVFIDYYALLDISFGCTFEEIRIAFRKAAKKYHPDVNPSDIEGATTRFQRIQKAYEILSESESRKEYDMIWRHNKNYNPPDEHSSSGYLVSQEDWQFAIAYFPSLDEIAKRLRKISEHLENRWRCELFFSKQFPSAQRLADQFEEAHVASIVGASPVLREAYTDAILTNNDNIEAEIRNAVRLFGERLAEEQVLKIFERHVDAYSKYRKNKTIYRDEIYKNCRIIVFDDLTCSWDEISKSQEGGFENFFSSVFEVRQSIDRFRR